MTKRTRIALFLVGGLVIIFAGIVPPVVARNRLIALRQQCFNNLLTIDHSLNCGGLVPGPPGTPIDPKTVPFDGWRQVYPKDEGKTHSIRCCPCGPEYQVEYRVGSHPICPVHGNMVGESGLIHHERGPKPLPRIPFPNWGFATSSISIIAALVIIVTGCRKQRNHETAQPISVGDTPRPANKGSLGSPEK